MLPFFNCSKFSVWDYNTSDVTQGKHSQSIDRKYNCHECWCYIICIKQCFPHTNLWLLLHVLAKWRKSLSTWMSVFGGHFSALFLACDEIKRVIMYWYTLQLVQLQASLFSTPPPNTAIIGYTTSYSFSYLHASIYQPQNHPYNLYFISLSLSASSVKLAKV